MDSDKTIDINNLSEHALHAASADELYRVASSLGYVPKKIDMMRYIVSKAKSQEPIYSVMEFALIYRAEDTSFVHNIVGKTLDELINCLLWEADECDMDMACEMVRDFMSTACPGSSITFNIKKNSDSKSSQFVETSDIDNEGYYRLERVF